MLISLLMWYGFGVLGSILVALGTSLDKEGFDKNDVLVLAFFAIAGPIWLIIGIPFGFMWGYNAVNSIFGDKK